TATSPEGTLDLTPHDILVFKVLAERRGEVVMRADIVEEVCGLESEATLRKVDNHVMALRRAIGDDPRRPRYIHTVRGEGYRLARGDADGQSADTPDTQTRHSSGRRPVGRPRRSTNMKRIIAALSIAFLPALAYAE